MKKLFAIFLALITLLSLAACGGNDAEVDTDADSDNNIITEEATVQEEEDSTSAAITRGEISGDKYVNEFIGVTFEKPSDWIFLSDDEIQDTLNYGLAVLDDENLEKTLAEAMEENANAYDMYAMDSNGNSVIVAYENTILTSGRKLSAETYIETLCNNFDIQSAIDYTVESQDTVMLGSSEFVRLIVTDEANGVAFRQAYYAKAIGKYIATFIVTLTTIDLQGVEAMFS